MMRGRWGASLFLVPVAILGNRAAGQTCDIDGVTYAAAEENPLNDCEACLPSQSAVAWTPLEEGSTCGDPSSSDCDNPDACDGLGFCEQNHKPDGITCSDSDPCTAPDTCFAGVCVGNPLPVSPAVEAAHARAIDVTALPPGSSLAVALRITSPDYPCLLKWLTPAGGTADSPVFQTPSVWGTVHVTGTDIVPGTLYEIRTECGSHLSNAGSATTSEWGDWNGSGSVDVDDIICTLDTFVGIGSICTFESVDVYPCEPDGLIDVGDILDALGAFIGSPFPCPPPC